MSEVTLRPQLSGSDVVVGEQLYVAALDSDMFGGLGSYNAPISYNAPSLYNSYAGTFGELGGTFGSLLPSVPAVIKYWNGSSWSVGFLNIYVDDAWQSFPVRYWTGSSWQT